MAAGVGYSLKDDFEAAPIMLLLAAFAFYALGRQVNLLSDLEAGDSVDTQPKAPAWIRGVTYFVVLLMIFSLMFS